MHDDDIDRISRSWAGHLATNPKLRTAAEAAAGESNEKLAALINQTVGAKTEVTAGDLPGIQAKLQQFFAGDAFTDRAFTRIIKTDPPGGG